MNGRLFLNRRHHSRLFAFVIAMCFSFAAPGPVAAQAADPSVDPWGSLRLLVGSWEGQIDGVLGKGTGVRDYEFIFDGMFLQERHASIRMPQDKSPNGDNHRELGIFSYDQSRNKIVYRQFVVEGFVLQYVCDLEPQRIACVTEHIENATDMSARWTVTVESRYDFAETFELLDSDGNVAISIRNRWTRRAVIR